MFHMLTCFNLTPQSTLQEFKLALGEFTKQMEELNLMHSTGPIGRRMKHEIMDTDDERLHEYFFITTFRDREQCDLAVDYILPDREPGGSSHRAVYGKVMDPVFICWEDV